MDKRRVIINVPVEGDEDMSWKTGWVDASGIYVFAGDKQHAEWLRADYEAMGYEVELV